MKESKQQIILNRYLRETRMYCYYELKVMRGKSLSFKNIEQSQKDGLPALQKNGLVWKLSDADRRLKPCDGLCTPPLPTYLVIKKDKSFYFVSYTTIENMIQAGDKKITINQCKEYAEKIIHS